LLRGRYTYINKIGVLTLFDEHSPLLISLSLCVGIKVADEWQISLDYVRGSNIYVRGYLDLRTWSLRLRA